MPRRNVKPGPLRVSSLLEALNDSRVEYVVTGSVAAMAYGVTLAPGDLDVAPDLGVTNLARLANLLETLGAKPKHVHTWKRGLSLEECERWSADPPDEKNLDHRFVTPHGELDVVPRLAGTYEELSKRAVRVAAFDATIRVAHLEDLIALCRAWDRETDRQRLPELIAARDRAGVTDPLDVGRRLTEAG